MIGGVRGLIASFMETVYILPAIIIAISFHEYAHAKVADYWGDDTPARQGRLTIDPLAHIDPMGLLALIFIRFGWGRPVMINPSKFRNKRAGLITVGLAGVTMNFILALVFGGIIKLLFTFTPGLFAGKVGEIAVNLLLQVVYINLALMLFNLLPVPPLDGFNVISEIFKLYNTRFYAFVRTYSLWILMAMIMLRIPSMLLSGPLSFIADFILSTIYKIY